jgi:osmotically-inducible protein OsmY
MKNRNHNRRGVLNTSNPDWNEDRGKYGRGHQNHGYENSRNDNFGREGDHGNSIGGRYEDYGSDRHYNQRGGYGENMYSRDSGFNRDRYNEGRDEGSYNERRYGGTSGDYGRDYLNYGSERGANQRGGDEYNRYNYDNRGNRGSNFGGGSYGTDYNRNRRSDQNDDRGWWDKASDEVSSWFGDDDAERRRDSDRIRSGQHKGKGPKGYSRSDERIKEDVNDRLADDVFVDASDIEVTVNQGDVTLTGVVQERSEKRRAEDIVEAISGVKNVENRIRVGSGSTNVMNTSGLGSTSSEISREDKAVRSKTTQNY